MRADAVWSHGRILSNWNFWTIGFVVAAISGINQALVITVVPYGAGLGFSLSSTALFISGFSITAAVTKVASGAAETVPYISVTNLARTMRELKDRNIWITGADEHATVALTLTAGERHDLIGFDPLYA